MEFKDFNDIHTHTPGLPGSVLSIPASEIEGIIYRNESLPPEAQQYYSIQLHPWHLHDEQDLADFRKAVAKAESDPHFVAIGECGLDSLCQTPLALQLQAFHKALILAQELRKPVVIHCVRLWAEMRAEVVRVFGTSLPLDPPLIIHGFRKGPALARQLLDAGFCISLGTRFNSEVQSLVPPSRLFHETD